MSSAPQLSLVIVVSAEIVRGPNQGQKLTFQQEKWTAGRGPENDLVLAQDLKISRNHLEVVTTTTQVFVRNISQKNIMMIDGLLAVENIMKSDSVVQIGETYIRFKFDRPAEKPVLTAVASLPFVAAQAPALTAASNLSFPKAAGGLNQYSAPPAFTPPPAVDLPLFSHPKFKFYAMIGVFGLVVLWFMQTPKKEIENIRDSVVISEALDKSQSEVEQILTSEKQRGVDTPQFRLAEAQFIKGFRDYQQGQYARAKEAFQSARSFYPKHELATRYWTMADRKQNERIQHFMEQGRRYMGTNNYRLCESSFATALVMIKDDKNPLYQEARQFHEECRVKASSK